MKLFPFFRQWLYIKEFRIKKADYPLDLPMALEEMMHFLSVSSVNVQESEQAKNLADIATNLWRLRQKMVQPGTDQPLEEMRRAYRHLESSIDALERANIRIQDHTGDLVPPGLQLKVLARQPLPGIIHDQVQETIKPTIYYQNQMIQMGEVIVSVPDEKEAND